MVRVNLIPPKHSWLRLEQPANSLLLLYVHSLLDYYDGWQRD